jgi:hypothetical protein
MERIGRELARFRHELDERFAHTDERFDAVEKAMAGLRGEFSGLRGAFSDMLDKLEGEFRFLYADLDVINRRLDRLEERPGPPAA